MLRCWAGWRGFGLLTGALVGQRLGVSVQRANARLRRLEGVGLIERETAVVGQARAVWVSRAGLQVLGHRGRARPRPDVQRHHELGVVWTAIRFEHRWPDARVLTERECRTLDAPDRRYSVDVEGSGRGDRRRWPDLVVQRPAGRLAVELEFTPKWAQRLESIMAGYAYSDYREVRWIVTLPTLAARITQLARLETHRVAATSPTVRVSAWPQLPADARQRIAAAARSA